MSMVTELLMMNEARDEASYLLKVLQEAIKTNNSNVKSFVGKWLYNQYIYNCATAEDAPSPDIVKEFSLYLKENYQPSVFFKT